MTKLVRDILEIIVLLAVLLASAAIVRQLWFTPARSADSTTSLPVPRGEVSIVGAPQKGSPNAPVVMIVYSDFQCPFCVSFTRDTLPQIESEYVVPGIVAIAFRNVPIERIHPLAMTAAEAGVCAHRQEGFWPWHDALFRSGSAPTLEVLEQVAGLVGLDMTEFKRCVERRDGSAQVKDELREAGGLGIRGTPTFLLGSKQTDGAIKATVAISGARPYADFKKAIDSIARRDASR